MLNVLRCFFVLIFIKSFSFSNINWDLCGFLFKNSSSIFVISCHLFVQTKFLFYFSGKIIEYSVSIGMCVNIFLISFQAKIKNTIFIELNWINFWSFTFISIMNRWQILTLLHTNRIGSWKSERKKERNGSMPWTWKCFLLFCHLQITDHRQKQIW